jgi:hypothetical protein
MLFFIILFNIIDEVKIKGNKIKYKILIISI